MPFSNLLFLFFFLDPPPRETCSRLATASGASSSWMLAFPVVSARTIVQPGASGAVVLLTTRVVRRPLLAPTVDDDAALAQRLQSEEEECAAAASAQTESDAELARELAAVLPFAAAPPPSHSAFGAVVLEGLLEKKPVRGLGMMERGLFPNGGFRARRVVLREVLPQPLPPAMVADGAAPSRRSCQLEWHHTDEDEAAPSSVRLELGTARVRRGGDVGDDEPERLLTVCGRSVRVRGRGRDWGFG